MARTAQPRAALEMLLVRLSRRPPLVPVDDLLDRLVQLEKRIRQAGGRPGGTQVQPAPAPAPRPQAQPSRRETRTDAANRGGATRDDSADDAEPPPESKETASQATPARVNPGSSTNGGAENRRADNTPAPSRVPSAEATLAPKSAPPEGSAPAKVETRAATQPARTAPPHAKRASSDPTTAARGDNDTETSSEDFEQLPTWERWRRIIDPLRRVDAGLGAFLDHAYPFEVTRDTVRIGFERDSVFRSTIVDPNNRLKIQEAAYRVLDAKPRFEWIENATPETTSTRTVFEVDKEARVKRQRDALERARSHPMVTEAVRVLGARVKHIAVPEN